MIEHSYFNTESMGLSQRIITYRLLIVRYRRGILIKSLLIDMNVVHNGK
jgi:hypothetical protein